MMLAYLKDWESQHPALVSARVPALMNVKALFYRGNSIMALTSLGCLLAEATVLGICGH